MIFNLMTLKYGIQTVLIDDEDEYKLKNYNWTLWSTPRHNGIYVIGYLKRGKNKSIRLHRLIVDAKPGEIVDHINGNPLDNRKENLRKVSSQENNQNARKRKNSLTSKYKGVHFSKSDGKWKAQIQVNKRKIALGSFNKEIEAAIAYNNALDKFSIVGPRNIVNIASNS